MTITMEELRDYLRRRKHEADIASFEAREKAAVFVAESRQHKHQWEVGRIANTRARLYEELVDIIDRGELPV